MSELIGYPATWSSCRSYRYTLWRQWLFGDGFVQFVGLNPSTATETVNDRTVARCISFAQALGFKAMCMTNLFAFRATQPKDMKAAADPVGPDNDQWLKAIAQRASGIIACYGADGRYSGRDAQVLELLAGSPAEVMALRLTKSGMPEHPLYLPGTCRPVALSELLARREAEEQESCIDTAGQIVAADMVQREMDLIDEQWGEYTLPNYWWFRTADGRQLWVQYKDLTVAICEQIVEQHVRAGVNLQRRYVESGSSTSARTAAMHFMRARMAREIYNRLCGIEHSEATMPVTFEKVKE